MVGVSHNMRNCTKGRSVGKVVNTVLEHYLYFVYTVFCQTVVFYFKFMLCFLFFFLYNFWILCLIVEAFSIS